ncbi:MAG: 16S rRNA (guanine(966)-N(2))-methyltransferase RsmD, partial [Aggregatilineales bacterium]
KKMWEQCLTALEANPTWIPEGTEIIVQIDPKEYNDFALNYLQEYDQRKYGKTMLVFYESHYRED